MSEHLDQLMALVLALEQQRAQAMLDGDAGAMGRLLDEDVFYAHSSGLTDTRDSFLAKFRQGIFRYTRVESRIDSVLVLGPDAFLAHGGVAIDAVVGGQARSMTALMLLVWRRREGEWRLAGHQTTLAPG